MSASPRLYRGAFCGALLGGLLVALLTLVVTHAGPEGVCQGVAWSYRGNGALAVVAAGLAGVLGGGWAGVGLWHLRRPAWGAALGTGILLALLAVTASAFPVLCLVDLVGPRGGPPSGSPLGPEAVTAYLRWSGLLAALALLVAALVGSLLAGVATRAARPALLVGGVLALAILGVFVGAPGLLAGFTFLLLPLAVSMPVLVTAYRTGARGSLLGACLLVLLGFFAGVVVGGLGAGILTSIQAAWKEL